MNSSTPAFCDFDPKAIPYQWQVIELLANFDYKQHGVPEILLSGAVGSAKSSLMAHAGLGHVLDNPGAHLGLCRLSMPDLRSTILSAVLEHLSTDPHYVEGEDWEHNKTKGSIEFWNGSLISSTSWHDKKFKRFRSKAFSAVLVEELSENDDQYKEFYGEMKLRVGRLPHIEESWIMSATNPDSPSHWVYKYFMEQLSVNRMVFYSKTRDNPFLPKTYIEKLERELDPRTKRRMLDGEWLELTQDVIYYAYSPENNFKRQKYQINPYHPIYISHDFNIGLGKPMSACLFQFIDDTFHIFAEVILDSSRTLDVYDELAGRGLFDIFSVDPITKIAQPLPQFYITGDRNGSNQDTRYNKSDYELIRDFLSNFQRKDGRKLQFQISVPKQNPALRSRHNRTNAYCQSSDGRFRLFVYIDAPTVNEGMRLTALKKGGNYIEDDSKRFQHVSTAVGYGIMEVTKEHAEVHTFNRWGRGI